MAEVVINGKAYDHNHTHIKIDGDEVVGVTNISYDVDQTPEKVFGTHAQPIATVEGQFKPTATITLLKHLAREVRIRLAEKAATGESWSKTPFDITVNYEVTGLDMETDDIIQCTVAKVVTNSQSGTNATTEEWTLDPQDIKLDGLSFASHPLY